MQRLLLIIAAAVAVAVFVWRPPAPSAAVAVATADPARAGLMHHRKTGVSSGMGAIVYVAGAVAHPGLYRLHSGARADDAVRSAGGFRRDADTGAINLAARVADGDEVYVAVLGAPTAPPGRRSRTRQTGKQNTTVVVDLNSATASELAMVPGIGATLAARIVEVRERDGAYGTFDELLDVAGMSASRLARAEPHLRI